MPDWNITPEIPDLAVSLRTNYPPRDSWDGIDDGGLNGRSGDLLPHLELARDNDQVVSLEPGGSYDQSDGLDIYDAAETGIVCDPSNPATIYFDGVTDSLYRSHLGGCDTFVLEGVNIVFENEGSTDAALVTGTFEREFWSKGVSLNSRRDQNGRPTQTLTFSPFIADPSGTGYVQDLSMMEGDIIRPENDGSDHTTAVATDPNHNGTITYWGVEIAGFGGAGYYMANCPDGRAILVDCYGRDNGGSIFRMGSNDAVIGGTAEQHNGPIDMRDGPGHCLSAYYGPPQKFVGVTCRGDLYGNAMALARDDRNGAPSTLLDRCVFHVDGDESSPVFRLQDGAEWELRDCHVLDESSARSSFSGQADITSRVMDGTITSDSTWHYSAPNNPDIRLDDSGARIDHEGTLWTGYANVGIKGDLALADATTPLPEPYIDESLGGSGGGESNVDDRLVIARNAATQELESDVEVWMRPTDDLTV